MSNKAWARLALITAGGAVVLLAAGNGMHLMYAGIIDLLLLAAAVLYQRQPVRVVEVLVEREPDPVVSSAPVPLPSLPVVEPAWPGAEVKVALEHLTQVVQQTEDDMRFANQLARGAGERVQASAVSMQSSAAVLGDLDQYLQRLDQVFDELGSRRYASVRLSAASRTSPGRPTCWRSTPRSKPRGPVTMAVVLPWWRMRCAICRARQRTPVRRSGRSRQVWKSRRRMPVRALNN
jgi:hypothetical protein